MPPPPPIVSVIKADTVTPLETLSRLGDEGGRVNNSDVTGSEPSPADEESAFLKASPEVF